MINRETTICPALLLLLVEITRCENAIFVVAVPGGNEGPSGVLICSENYITYKNFGDQPDIRCPIPRRRVRLYVTSAFILVNAIKLF